MAFNIQTHREVTQVETIQDTSLGIMKWGWSNSFPQTLKNLISQSPNAKKAVSRTAKFYKGKGFKGDDTVVSSNGLTLRNVVAIVADDLATFNAFAIQCNYNLKGQVANFVPIRIAELRFNEFDELNSFSKVGYHPDFGHNAEVRKTIQTTVSRGKIKWIDKFNPQAVFKQIENTKGGMSNYQGQVLYFSENGNAGYPEPTLQAPINYVLSDIENSILVRKETATGFINTYLLKTMLDHEDPNLIALETSIEEAQGARGSGKVISMTGLSPEEMTNTVLEKIDGGGSGGGTIIENATTCFDLDEKVINGAYLIPPLLSGSVQENGFSQAGLRDAYFVFNAITQDGRESIEFEINRILKNSVFEVKEIKLEKLTLDEEVPVETPVTP